MSYPPPGNRILEGTHPGTRRLPVRVPRVRVPERRRQSVPRRFVRRLRRTVPVQDHAKLIFVRTEKSPVI